MADAKEFHRQVIAEVKEELAIAQAKAADLAVKLARLEGEN